MDFRAWALNSLNQAFGLSWMAGISDLQGESHVCDLPLNPNYRSCLVINILMSLCVCLSENVFCTLVLC